MNGTINMIKTEAVSIAFPIYIGLPNPKPGEPEAVEVGQTYVALLIKNEKGKIRRKKIDFKDAIEVNEVINRVAKGITEGLVERRRN
jgi:hypothetical protein